jgi:hypothetical protein
MKQRLELNSFFCCIMMLTFASFKSDALNGVEHNLYTYKLYRPTGMWLLRSRNR